MYIFDLDGTISLNEHRQHYLPKQGKKDWAAWTRACIFDDPNHNIVRIMRELYYGNDIHIVSGRSMSAHQDTLRWLDAHGVCYDTLTMRPIGDHRDDTIIKLEMLRRIEAEHPNDVVIAIFDDRQKVVDMWRREGYTCLQVAPGDF